MRARDRLHHPFRLPSPTIRLRLTILYASLFLASGIGLLSITYVLVRHATGQVLVGTKSNGSTFMIAETTGKGATSGTQAPGPRVTGQYDGGGEPRPLTEQQLRAQMRRDRALAEHQHAAELHQLLEQSGFALALMAAASIALGWFAAGRVLRPLRTINERAREISASSLHKRLALDGPDDEVTQLASTFDELLERLEGSFSAQRQFVANASHELRTPLARAQALTEVALSDPEATLDTLRASHQRVLVAGRQQERLIEALLTLARSERGLDEREPFDLATVTGTVLRARRHEAERHGIQVLTTLERAEMSGNPQLAERLVANLIDNALRHNLPRGSVEVRTATTSTGQAIVSVANSGPLVPPAELERLFQPFQRLGAARTDHSDGIGLGLSIVAAIATAHGATLTTRAQAGGGLGIEVRFQSVEGPRLPETGQPPEAAPAGRALRLRRRRQPKVGAQGT
jgi:signal transduction histidine kinase